MSAQADQAVIRKLEQRLGIVLPRIEFDKMYGPTNGHAVDVEGRIVGLNLYENQLTGLPPEIVELKNLQTLDLGGNRRALVMSRKTTTRQPPRQAREGANAACPRRARDKRARQLRIRRIKSKKNEKKRKKSNPH